MSAALAAARALTSSLVFAVVLGQCKRIFEADAAAAALSSIRPYSIAVAIEWSDKNALHISIESNFIRYRNYLGDSLSRRFLKIACCSSLLARRRRHRASPS